MTPIHQRDFHLFLSHASADKKVVIDQLYEWLTQVAGLRVWYDSDALSGGVSFGSALADAIPQCRALVVMLSKASLQSGWVDEEYQLAMVHQKQWRDFRIIPVVMDDSTVPGFLATKNYIRMPNAELTLDFVDALLKALSSYNPARQAAVQYGRVKDIYASRTWREDENALADEWCGAFTQRGFRLIGDSRDQRVDDKARIRTIMQSCGGLVGLLPYRADEPGFTSPYMIEEVQIAADLRLPYAIVMESGVQLADALKSKAVSCVTGQTKTDLSATISALNNHWQQPTKPHYVFYATDFDPTHEKRTQIIRKMLERVTGMQCLLGEEMQPGFNASLQHAITDRIINAFLVVADVTGDNLNTIIEAGIARGARVPTILISGDTRHDPPFMFRDQQIYYYADDIEMVGRVNKLIRPYRRRVIDDVLG